MARRFYSCDGSDIEYSVRKQTRWSERKLSVLAVKISVTNRHCSGEYLRCQLLWGRELFDQYVFSVGDLLNEYSYQVVGHPVYGKLSPAHAKRIAHSEGESWCTANFDMISEVLSPGSFKIIRWDSWRKAAGFDDRVRRLKRLAKKDSEVRKALEADALDYLRRQRYERTLSTGEMDIMVMHTLEELAADQTQAEASPTLFLYPGDEMQTYRVLDGNPLAPSAIGEMDYRYIELRKRSARANLAAAYQRN